MKKFYKHLIPALAAICFAAGCANPFIAPKAAPEAEYRSAGEGTGLALIRLEGTQGGRTLLPAIVAAEFYYVLDFTPGTGNDAEALTVKVDRSSAKSLELLAGPWSLDVKGYIDAAHAEDTPDDPGLTGSADFTITAGSQAEVEVALSAAQTEYGQGEFAYTVSFPANVSPATLSLINITGTGNQGPVDLLDGAVEADGVKTASGIVPEVWAGFYRLVLDLSVQIDGIPSRTLRTRVVRIHDSLQTGAVESFTEADFFKGRKFDDLTELKNYLDGVEQNTKDTPYPVALSAAIDLSSGGLADEGGDALGALYGALTRFVDLDLSECQGAIIGQEFGGSYNRINGPSLVSVTLPPGLTAIGRFAFDGCANLDSVGFPDGVTTINEGAFRDCASLASITWPPDITFVGSFAFRDSGLSGALALPATLTYFNNLQDIFSGTNITSVDLSAMTDLEGIGGYMFTDCKELREVILPFGLASFRIDAHAFRGCESLDTLNWEVFSTGSLSVNQNGLFTDTAFSTLPSLDIFTSSGFPGAINMPNLVAVDLTGWTGTGVSFQNCANLEFLTLNAALTAISTPSCPKVRYNLGSNTNFTGDAGSTGNVMLLKDSGITLVAVSGATGSNITIPANVTAMAANLFQNNTDLVSVDMSACSLVEISWYAFQGCTALEDVTFSASTTTIGPYAFLDCTALTEVTLPIGLTQIDTQAFSNCGIQVITLPSSLISFNETVFWDSPLKTVKIPHDLEAILQSTSFSGVVYELLPGGGGGGYEVFAEGKLVVKDHEVLFVTPEFSGALVLPASVTAIAANAFQETGITSVDMSPCISLTDIGNYAFRDTPALTSVIFPASLTTIGRYIFQNSNIMVVDLSPCTSLTAFSSYAFREAKALTSVALPSSLTSVGLGAFYETGLISVDLSPCTSLATINTNAFRDTPALASVTFPATLTAIATHAFNGSGITSADLSACTGMTSIGASAFYNAEALASVTLPTSLTTIGDSAFYNCASLSSITFPATLTTIGDNAFQTSGLEWVKWPASGTTAAIGNSAFNGASKLRRVELPDNLSSIGDSAFATTNLAVLILRAATAPTLGTTPFPAAAAFAIYVPDTGVAAYKLAPGWSDRAEDIDGITNLPAQDVPSNW